MMDSEVFEAGRAYIGAHGWRQESLGRRDKGERACLAGCLPIGIMELRDLITGGGRFHNYIYAAIMELYGDEYAGLSTVLWNDDEGTTQQMVESVLAHARKLAECDEMMSPL